MDKENEVKDIDGTWRQGFIVNSCIFLHIVMYGEYSLRKLSKKPCRQVLSLCDE